MILLIDAGNTRLKWAIVNGTARLRSGVLPIEHVSELPSYFADSRDIREIWVSNVAGEEVARHISNIEAGETRFIVAQKSQCGVRNGYSDAAQLGSDRWAAMIGAWHEVRAETLVVNCGTATTIDALSAKGDFLGGLILPGIELMLGRLVNATSNLQENRGNYVSFPLNTADALFSGAIQASCGAIERQKAKLGKKAKIVLSGGAAGLLQPHLEMPTCNVDNLVLRGLELIAQEATTG